MTSAEAYTHLVTVFACPERVAEILCNYFDSTVLTAFVETLYDENDIEMPE